MLSAAHLQLLKSVSRSFYLSIRFLPPAMREPVALGYLLARLTDTIADAEGLEKEKRIDVLNDIRTVVEGSRASLIAPVADLAEEISHPGERELLRRSAELIEWFRGIDPANQGHLSEVILTIIHGQIWDTTFFKEGQITASRNRDELLRYTYQVAGCVGEFWTKVGFTNLGAGFSHPDDAAMMLVRGRKLGQGLQLINILRDLHEDLPGGRIYLPGDELRAAGWDGDSTPKAEQVDPVFQQWLSECESFLENAEPYSKKVRNYRAAFCTGLPMKLAVKTAAELRAAGCGVVMREKVKISRNEVWKAMIQVGLF
ncbi:MAG: phytoene/squalene synthase family protein [Verrucomicrobiales bacterium]|nr:phytoene/squalene synthase family protein [Verrucomicrobiales bacterium]